jgi:hypothetical protein
LPTTRGQRHVVSISFISVPAGNSSCRSRALVLEFLVLEPLPALQRVVVPRASGEILVEVVVAVGEDVEPRALLLGEHDGVRVEELLSETDVEQRRVERPTP